jgi:hypothetical protein
MSRKNFFGIQPSTVSHIVPLMETNVSANFCIYILIFRGCSMEVKFCGTDAFALAAFL